MALIGSLDSGISALKAFTKGIEVIGDSIANVNTVAFKTSRVDYTDGFTNILRRATASPGGTNPGSNQGVDQVGSGVNLGSVRKNFKQGSIQSTGIKTDLSIVGNGFFKVKDSVSQEAFASRAGDFRTDDRDFIVTQDGLRLQGAIKPAAAMPTYTATLNSDGSIEYTLNAPANPNAASVEGDIKANYDVSTTAGNLINSTGLSDAIVNASAPALETFEFDQNGFLSLLMSNGDSFSSAQLMLMNFKDEQALVREGNGRYSGFEAAGSLPFSTTSSIPGINGLGSIKSGALELSNVDLTEEFANIISTQRSFQAGARVISVSDDILNEIVNLVR